MNACSGVFQVWRTCSGFFMLLHYIQYEYIPVILPTDMLQHVVKAKSKPCSESPVYWRICSHMCNKCNQACNPLSIILHYYFNKVSLLKFITSPLWCTYCWTCAHTTLLLTPSQCMCKPLVLHQRLPSQKAAQYVMVMHFVDLSEWQTWIQNHKFCQEERERIFLRWELKLWTHFHENILCGINFQ